MHIEWVNHASFIVDHNGVRLISDPWLFGSAFADSWDLLSPTRFQTGDWASITHIWLSHEHPDHFSPPSLKSIPEEYRRRIVVMTQRTRDRRVASYCRGLGFAQVIEMRSGEWLNLGPEVSVMCQPVKLDDSWLAIRAGDSTVLNLNDCLLGTESEVRGVLAQVGRPIDVLLTQFSFAAWIGNREDQASHDLSARVSRERFMLHARTVQPQWVIPFASYVWFSHEENAFMNDAVNRVQDIVAEVRRSTTITPLVLYPGDTWRPGQPEDPTSRAIEAYVADSEACATRPRHETRPQTIEELQIVAAGYSRQLLRFHGPLLRLLNTLGLLRPTPVWLRDHGKAVMFSMGGLSVSTLGYAECDVALTSDALAYTLQHMWGGMTLIISGRFEVPSGGNIDTGGPPQRFKRYVQFADDVNHGWPLHKEILFRLRNALPFLQRIPWAVRHTPDADRPPV